ncbi:aspartate/methionine/tyrosine aminotransferase [Chitinivorax tropicus]|uniref:Aspartate/methionine/tyrosine aminotransferase n=1 Tax=Chitinivorax tropicus TaxID=714531 RepID=A0A840MHG0_9PROT|nr:aminotransferase class I/II-fold pyridoxal phosphate-dependent enzyme [Chitinivorax tropicus]MBB5018654.1 aspartate/methionine/tyrosine aminotransferase [Chitinivorax tropicus]
MPTPPLANRLHHIEPFRVMALLARAKALEAAGRDVIHMEIGEPDFPTPPAIVEAGIRALQAGHTSYTPALGIPLLRQAIADFYADHYGVAIPAAQVAVTPGASGALQLALSALLSPGDEVILSNPTYPCNRHFIQMFEGVPIMVDVGPAENYQLTAAKVAAHWSARTKAVMVASPANPTGTLIAPDELDRIGQLCQERGAVLIVDEIYQGLVYDGPDRSVLSSHAGALVINSFSKYFQMTGWRLGWMVAPEYMMPAIEKLAMNAFLSPSAPSQYAALAAFEPDTLRLVESRRQALRARRDYLTHALLALGFDIPAPPQGAFYVYADARRHTRHAEQFAADLLEAHYVAVTPGIDFGGPGADQALRFAYTTSLPRLQEAIQRIKTFIDS